VAIVAVGIGFRVVFDQVDLTTAFFVLILAPEVYLPVRQVGVHYHDAADGMAAAESAFAIIESAPEPAPRTASTAPTPGAPLLSVDDLSHTYPGAEAAALAPVALELRGGELAVVTGPSGSGKTTLLNALMGFITPTDGRILVGGAALDPATRRERVAWVGQTPGLVSGTIADNVRLADPAADDTAVRLALQRAGGISLDPARGVGDDGEGLSAGERRRVAVARALLRVASGRADLLVLDEPTAGLDAATETALLDAVRELGVTTLAVSHRPAVIARADRVIDLTR
jgi:ABC-type transport system involved in cytochrome bd biosynthesis fused ATPase/permease subunit